MNSGAFRFLYGAAVQEQLQTGAGVNCCVGERLQCIAEGKCLLSGVSVAFKCLPVSRGTAVLCSHYESLMFVCPELQRERGVQPGFPTEPGSHRPCGPRTGPGTIPPPTPLTRTPQHPPRAKAGCGQGSY